MENLVRAFPQHIEDALEIARSASVVIDRKITNIVISGLGGSGIGGSILRSLFGEECPVPIITNNDYHLPAFADENTLLIISSYSGNTEETVAVMEAGISRNCVMACVTSGGKVLELAEANNLPTIVIPGGNPPRSMLAFSLIQLIAILHQNGWCVADALDRIESAGKFLAQHQDEIIRDSADLAPELKEKIPVLYIAAHREPIAIRWRQQLNENSKMLCWHHVFPEMNHNELVGWEIATDNLSVVMIKTDSDYERTRFRMDTCRGIFEKKSPVNEILAQGSDDIQQAFYLIHFGDWLSLELAKLNGQDATTIDNIDYLKNKLSELV